MQKRNKKELFILLIKSILMGTANKLPGISGGLVALITGFYNEMINTFKKIDFKTFSYLIRGDIKKFNNNYNGLFLITVLFGIVISYFTTSQILDYFFKISELNVWSIFYGMIIASIVILIKKNKIKNRKEIFFLIFGLSIGLILSFSEPLSENKNILFVFFCGFISICGMVIPGISGSFLLILLGNYKLLLVDSVNTFFEFIKNILGFENSNEIDFELIKILFIFCLGSIIGLVLLSNLLSFLIRKYTNQINQLIIGFVTGSLIIIWPWKKVYINSEVNINSFDNIEITNSYLRYLPDLSESNNIIALIWILIGFLFVIYIENYGSRKKNIWTIRKKY
ncbi:MAG: DUF368 domain-containing protein [Flavobacteriaceae bacterium]|nr:DUF368 domain-containing protein [Flavobacteriaceae bacterium]|tara:strand:- start:178 stop:1194 length:1017 start_codon:yes stop_codon:yes gene_type:complete